MIPQEKFKACEIWITLNVIFIGIRIAASTCPGVCFCPSLTRIVYCPRKNLPFIPFGIPAETVQLNLNDNNFYHKIKRENFTKFAELEQLYLTGCGIEYIEVDTFIDNKRLKWLDIGKNKLKTIYDFTFRDLTLEHLFLNDNPGVKIQTRAFGGLKSMGLYIQNNAIDKLSLEVLRPMNGTLKTLWLDGNKFENFNFEWLYLFRTLSHLRVGENPLHCNCEASWLHEFYTTTSRIFEGGSPPSCRSPGRLRGKLFNELDIHDFKCQLPVFKNVDVIFDSNVGKMTCLASGDPVPKIYWMKPDGESEVFIPKSEDLTKDMEGVLYVTNPRSSNKNRYQCVASNPAGNVTFSLNVAWPTTPEYEPEEDQNGVMKDGYTDIKPVGIEDDKYSQKEETKDSYIYDEGKNSPKTAPVVQNDSSAQFSTGDIIGAVVGTFVLTLIACVIVFHFFSRHQRNLTYQGQNGVTSPDCRRGPPSRYELDEVEHSLKMLEKNNIDIHV